MASAINAGLQSHNANLDDVIADRCVLWDFSAEQYVTASCDSEARFVCERGKWHHKIFSILYAYICNLCYIRLYSGWMRAGFRIQEPGKY